MSPVRPRRSRGTRIALHRGMTRIELDDAEIDTLQEILHAQLSQLMVESRRADAFEYKAKLQHKREIVEHLLERLGSNTIAPKEVG